MEEVFIEPYITIKLDRQVHSVVSDWTGSPTTEQFKQGKEQVFTVLMDSNSSIVVLNYEHLAAYINLETQVWTVNEWFPRVLKDHNVKRIGIVIPSKVMAQIVVKAIFSGVQKSLVNSGIEIGYFDSTSQLTNWLSGNETNIPLTYRDERQTGASTVNTAVQQQPSTASLGGVDLGDNKASNSTSYDDLDDVVHDDPFA
ncbi:MAG: hypothetical protein ACPGJS_18360 [Flammeovirgaceae bacterium]